MQVGGGVEHQISNRCSEKEKKKKNSANNYMTLLD